MKHGKFFHAETRKYIRRCKTVLAFIIIPLAQAAFLAAFTLLFEMQRLSEIPAEFLLGTICASAALALASAWIACEITRGRIMRHSRYTFFDIQPRCAVFSRYAGTVSRFSNSYCVRTLYVIPFSDFKEACVTGRKRGKSFIIKGKIRIYTARSTSLGYHVENGDIFFDCWWLDVAGFDIASEVRIPPFFADPHRIAAELNAAKLRFDNLPPPEKHVFEEAETVKIRKMMEMNNLQAEIRRNIENGCLK